MASAVLLFSPTDGGAPALPGLDKVVHALIFATLAGVTRWRFGSERRLLVPVAGYAVVSELVQGPLLATRSGDPWDVAADLVGTAVGWLVAGRLLRR